MPELVDRLDGFQRQHPVVAYPLAVVYKYFDDQGAYLAAILTYYTFVAIFPMLLIASSVLGFILQGDEQLKQQLLDSALAQFPIVGQQLGAPGGIQGSTSAVVIGSITALYGMIGLGQAAQNAMNQVWAIPRNGRLNPFLSRFRSLLGLVVGGLTVLALAALTTFGGNLGSFGLDLGPVLRWGGTAVSVLLTAVVLAVMMRFTTTRQPTFRTSLPGALFISVCWHVLQAFGGTYVRHVINNASAVNGPFAIVLGLIGFIFVAAILAVIGFEVNVVLFERLYPRALLGPFTDHVDLTEADRRAYASYAGIHRYKDYQHVEVRWDPRKDRGQQRSMPPGQEAHRSVTGPQEPAEGPSSAPSSSETASRMR